MSSILEALKKLDRERNARKNGVINLEREILQPPLATKNNKWRYLSLLLVLIATIAVLLVFFWWRPLSKEKVFTSNEQIRQKITAPEASQSGRFPVPKPLTQKPVTQTKPPIPAQNTSPQAKLLPETPPTTSPQPFKAVPQPTPAASAPPVKKTPAPGPSMPRKQQQIQNRPLPSLTVAGIAFSDSRKARLAIVNGQPVTIGERIEGVKVEDISEDTVEFSWQGKTFTLGVGESSRK